ncbi:hypothetical protein PF011_g12669 [Phytophthora fragariae]|uniref:Secreted protein n=1 Tax=Phytophthora fragariae TaxID=53985 RepID=A0A6A3KEG1_9STRA|nr:hypothetical protein PF011_g12669 [Phytophthora fragariae]
MVCGRFFVVKFVVKFFFCSEVAACDIGHIRSCQLPSRCPSLLPPRAQLSSLRSDTESSSTPARFH